MTLLVDDGFSGGGSCDFALSRWGGLLFANFRRFFGHRFFSRAGELPFAFICDGCVAPTCSGVAGFWRGGHIIHDGLAGAKIGCQACRGSG